MADPPFKKIADSPNSIAALPNYFTSVQSEPINYMNHFRLGLLSHPSNINIPVIFPIITTSDRLVHQMAPFPAQPKLLSRPRPMRPASFHGSTATKSPEIRQISRPKTHPDLLVPYQSLPPPANPWKVLVKVTVQRSLGPVQVMAPTDWSVRDLVAAVIKIYIEEERLPLLTSADPSAFGLHYSQFCLESLDSKEKLKNLGSRNFFLCPKGEYGLRIGERPVAAKVSSPSRCWKEVEKGSRIGIPWLRFMDCLL